MDKIFKYISSNSKWFEQALDLRYRAFYEDLNLPKGITSDELERDSYHLICIHDAKVIGYGRLTIKNDKGKISQMAVDSSTRRKGIGTQIMTRLIQKAKQNNCKMIYLNSRVHAIDFYKRFDFVTVSDVFYSTRSKLPHKRMEKSI